MIVFETKTSKIEGLTRLDPDYYNPAYSEVVDKVRALAPLKISQVFNVQLGPAYSSKKIGVSDGIRIAKIGEVTNKRGIDEWVFLDKKEFTKFNSREILHDEILLTLTGDPPDVGKTYIPLPFCATYTGQLAFNQRVAKLKTKGIDIYYLYAFMSTEYFRIRFEQVALGIRQRNVSIPDLYNASVFIPSDEKEVKTISELIKNHFKQKEHYQACISKAQILIETNLGLDKLTFNQGNSFQSSFNQIVTCKRLDAQHYKLKYQELIDHLQSNFKCVNIREIKRYNRRGVQPIYVDKGDIYVINSEHIGNPHVDYAKLKRTSKYEFDKNPEAQVQQNDLLIYTTGAYVGRTSVYLHKDNTALAGNHANILRLKSEYDTAYFSMLFNSKVGKFQTEKYQRGSAQAELYPFDIAKFIMPLLKSDLMKEIGDLVRESLIAKESSIRYLNEAKTKIETLIEK